MGCKTNNCVKILIYSIILICQCKAQNTSENPVVTLEYGMNTNDKYFVEPDKSLQIIFKKSEARRVQCTDFYSGHVFIKNVFPNYDKDSVINVKRVTPDMSTRWSCIIYQRYHGPTLITYNSENYTATSVYFQIVVKGALSVDASINGEHLNFTRLGLNVKHDGATSYSFINGQNIEFVCASTDANYNYLKRPATVWIEYLNQNEEKIFEVPQINNDRRQLIRTKLTSSANTFHMDCICYTDSPEREYRYRTYFYEKAPDVQDNLIRLSVNGLLQQYVKINDTYLEYPPFRYINGEVITVTCETEREYSNNLLFYFDEKQTNNFQVIKMDNKIVAIINSSALLLNKKTILCKNIYENGKKLYKARMTFESDIERTDTGHAVGVFGLPRQNILYQYLSNKAWTTVYEYTVNETLNLGCVLNVVRLYDLKFEWNFNRGEFKLNCGDIRRNNPDLMKYAAQNFTRKLTESDDKKVIKCIAYSDSEKLNFAEVKLQLKDISNSENLELAEKNSYATILMYSAVCIAFTAIFVCSLIVWRKRAKMAKRLNNTYDNLSNQDESPIPPYPPQWDENDHYSKIDEGVMQENYTYHRNDRMEKYPHLRQSLAPTENHYTEIDDYLKTPLKIANANVNTNKNIPAPIKKNTYDTLIRDDIVNTQNTAIYGSVDKNNMSGPQNVRNYENINGDVDVNDGAYSYVYDTRVVAAKLPNKHRNASDYDVPFNVDEVNVDNVNYIGPESSKTNIY